MIVPRIGAIGTRCADNVSDVGGLEVSFVESFATGRYSEGNAVFEEYRAEFANCGGAIHVGHGVVNGTDRRAGFDAGEFIDCADFFHSEERACMLVECEWTRGSFGGRKGKARLALGIQDSDVWLECPRLKVPVGKEDIPLPIQRLKD